MAHMPGVRRPALLLLTASLALLAAACGPAAPQATIGDRVWRDANSNGLQDPAEPGAAAVEVGLYQEGGTLVENTTTDELGHYAFENVPAGRYFLQFIALQENDFTLPDSGGDDEADSDADPLTGRTDVFGFDPDQSDLSWDAGLTFQPTPTPAPPPLDTPTPVIPPTGGTFEFTAAFTEVEGTCGSVAYFEDRLVIEIAADGKTITFRQPSTGDVNTGEVLPDGSFEASSERESYFGTLEIVRDEGGNIVRVVLMALNSYEDVNGCVTRYEVEGDAEVEE